MLIRHYEDGELVDEYVEGDEDYSNVATLEETQTAIRLAIEITSRATDLANAVASEDPQSATAVIDDAVTATVTE